MFARRESGSRPRRPSFAPVSITRTATGSRISQSMRRTCSGGRLAAHPRVDHLGTRVRRSRASAGSARGTPDPDPGRGRRSGWCRERRPRAGGSRVGGVAPCCGSLSRWSQREQTRNQAEYDPYLGIIRDAHHAPLPIVDQDLSIRWPRPHGVERYHLQSGAGRLRSRSSDRREAARPRCSDCSPDSIDPVPGRSTSTGRSSGR